MDFNLPLHPLLFLAIGIAAFALSALLVFRSRSVHSPAMRALLFGLRAAAIAVMLLILANPTRLHERALPDRREENLFLLDTSESMGLERPETRLDRSRALIEPVLSDSPFAAHSQLFRFDAELRLPRRDDPESPAADGPATNLGAALVSLIEANSGRGVANIVVCSDGRVHDRARLGDAVRLAARLGIPISTYAAGNGQQALNLAIQNCLVERHVPPGSRIPVRVIVNTQGLSSSSSSSSFSSSPSPPALSLAEGSASSASSKHAMRLSLKDANGFTLAETDLPSTNGLTEHTFELSVGARSDEYRVELAAAPSEVTLDDNAFAFKIDVADPKIHVLYMEGSNHRDSRWRDMMEYELLEQAFEEPGDIVVDILTVDSQEAVGGRLFNVNAPARGYPETRDELFKYDVVICSDINRFIFSADQLAWTAELVAERGGGFCMIGGFTSFGSGGWDKTVWEKMIPVDMETFGQGYLQRPVAPFFPEEARKHPILQFDPDPAKNDTIIDAHPPFNGTNLVNRAKPGATTLAAYAARDDMPLICVQPYGKGRSMAFTSDAAGGWGERYQTEWGEQAVAALAGFAAEDALADVNADAVAAAIAAAEAGAIDDAVFGAGTRSRRSAGFGADEERDNRYYRKFWVNAVRWLAENSLGLHGAKLVGNTEALAYKPGETVKARARLVEPLEPAQLESAKVTARFELKDAKAIELSLDTETGDFRGELRIPDAPDQTDVPIVFLAADAEDKVIGEDRAAIRVVRVKKEFVQLDPDPQLLAELARVTGGAVIRDADDLERLLRANAEDAAKKTQRFRAPLWDTPWLWGLLILLLSAEWLARKILRFS